MFIGGKKGVLRQFHFSKYFLPKFYHTLSLVILSSHSQYLARFPSFFPVSPQHIEGESGRATDNPRTRFHHEFVFRPFTSLLLPISPDPSRFIHGMKSLAYARYLEAEAALTSAVTPVKEGRGHGFRKLRCDKAEDEPHIDPAIVKPFLDLVEAYISTQERYEAFNQWEKTSVRSDLQLASVLEEILRKYENGDREVHAYVVSILTSWGRYAVLIPNFRTGRTNSGSTSTPSSW